MKKRRETGVFIRVAIFAFAVFAVITTVQLQLQYNAEKARLNELQEEVEDLNEQKEQLENELAGIGNSENVIEVAKEKLNLRLPEEIIFYNDLYN